MPPIDLLALADRVAAAGDDGDLRALAAGLRAAATSSRPGATLAKSLRLQANRRSPARLKRADAFARMASCSRYAGMEGKRLYVAMLSDLERYATSAAWRADRAKPSCPYLPADWRAYAWAALRIEGAVPGHWKTIKRARGQILFVPGHVASSPSQEELSDDRSNFEAAQGERGRQVAVGGRLPRAD